jgi:hypothetical protein
VNLRYPVDSLRFERAMVDALGDAGALKMLVGDPLPELPRHVHALLRRGSITLLPADVGV